MDVLEQRRVEWVMYRDQMVVLLLQPGYVVTDIRRGLVNQGGLFVT